MLDQRNLKTDGFHSETDIKCFPSTLRWRNFKTQKWSQAILNLCLRKTREGKSHMIRLDMIIVISLFSICFIFKMFSVQKKTKSRCFQFLWFEERYQNAPFSSRIGVDGSPSRRNKVLQHSVKRPKTVNRIWCISSLGKAPTWPWKLIKICSVNRKGK